MTENIVLLTGAGISAESGLKTFRGEDGLWEGEPVTEVATPQAFQRNPERVQCFYNMRRAQLSEVQPNRAHRALAGWQASNSGITLVTQNVDDLHERAGNHRRTRIYSKLQRCAGATSRSTGGCCRPCRRVRKALYWPDPIRWARRYVMLMRVPACRSDR